MSNSDRALYRPATVLCALLLLCGAVWSQSDPAPIWTPDMAIDELMKRVRVSEVPKLVPDSSEDRTYLENGLRRSTFLEPARWLVVKDEVEVTGVRIIFSKYPLRNGVYEGHAWLLRDRLIELFLLDPDLNRADIDWEVVLQTDCRNDRQVATLFHGVEIAHAPRDTVPDVLDAMEVPTDVGEPLGHDEVITGLVAMNGQDPVQQDTIPLALLEERLSMQLDSLSADSVPIRGRADEAVALASGRVKLEDFQGRFGSTTDSVVWKVLERNPDWERVLVVADWTGSMYGFGAQALMWHMYHFETSGITWFTLFNDGDDKWQSKKKIGKTGGIYHGHADRVKPLIALYQQVMLKGSGGDGPENDIEALLRAIEAHPEHGEVVLIADNNACIRDMELLDLVDCPVRVVVCGVGERINAQLLEVAIATGGSLHTVELDIHNMEVKRNKKGEALTLPDLGLRFSQPLCGSVTTSIDPSYRFKSTRKEIKSALHDKNEVEVLDLSGTPMEKLPKSIGRLKRLFAIHLNRTGITALDERLVHLDGLRILEVNENGMTSLGAELSANRFLVRLSARANMITHIDPALASLQFLKELDVSENPLGTISDQLPTMRLTVLGLANTALSEWPVVVKRMKKLEQLDLSGNRLTHLVLGPSLPRRLSVLDVSENAITEIEITGPLPQYLRTVRLSGNPLPPGALTRLREAYPSVVFEYQ